MYQTTIHNVEVLYFRKNNTFRLVLSEKNTKDVSFGIELDLFQLQFLLKEMSFSFDKGKNARPVNWQIGDYFYEVTMGYMTENLFMISFVSTDKNFNQSTFVFKMSRQELGKLIQIMGNVNHIWFK